jgi:methionine synthase II (cobalamin-independent)
MSSKLSSARAPGFYGAPTIIGSLPHRDAVEGCKLISQYLKELPAWPQFPLRSHLENMYIQYSEMFPCIVVDDQKIRFNMEDGFDAQLEILFSDYVENNVVRYSVSRDYATGLYCLSSGSLASAKMVKGQLIGPISWGLSVTDNEGRGILYDDLLAEAIAKFLKLKAAWQERFLSTVHSNTVIFLDEPYLASLGSAFVALHPDQIKSMIGEVLSGISGLKGIHCCGSTDWPILLGLPVDIISFDAYNYLDSLLCYKPDLISFLHRGKALAWGIVPNDEVTLQRESVTSLYDRLMEAMYLLAMDSLTVQDIVRQSIITPTCGLASLSPAATEYALQLLNELSARIREAYGNFSSYT